MSIKPRILIVASFPPPIHGSSLMSQYIKDSEAIKDEFDSDYVNLGTSRCMNEIGSCSPIKLIRWTTALLKLLILLMRHRYQLCYLAITCHGPGFIKDALYVLLCKLFGNKIVIHQHNKGMINDIDRYPYKLLLPLCYKNAKVILLSWSLYPDIEKIVPKENVFICPNGITDNGYDYQERNHLCPGILFVSNLIPSKGVYTLLDSLKSLADKGRAFKCDIVGSETTEITTQRINDEISNRGLLGCVHFHGKKYGKEKESFFKDADLFVFPTFYANECFPLVLLEAMQYGLPIVTTDEGGIPDIVEDGLNGIICQKRSSESLANAIEGLLANKNKMKEMGIHGLEKYKENYTLIIFEQRLTQILNNVVRS